VLTGSDDKTARLWDPATGQEIRHLRMATAQAVQAAQAAHTARTIIKSRARTFALIPALLENIEPKLSILTPRQMAARAAQLFREEITAPRWIGFGGDGPVMNLKTAAWYARYLRANEAAGKRRRRSGAARFG
jgi:hypothetical protein